MPCGSPGSPGAPSTNSLLVISGQASPTTGESRVSAQPQGSICPGQPGGVPGKHVGKSPPRPSSLPRRRRPSSLELGHPADSPHCRDHTCKLGLARGDTLGEGPPATAPAALCSSSGPSSAIAHTWMKLYVHGKHARMPLSGPYARPDLLHLEPGPSGAHRLRCTFLDRYSRTPYRRPRWL